MVTERVTRDDIRALKIGQTGIYTGEGRRDWVFYTLSTNIFGRKLNEALASLPMISPSRCFINSDLGILGRRWK